MACAQPQLPKPVTDFGTALKRARVGAGLSQEELAERARISVQAIGSYERGIRNAPRRDTLARIVHALDVTDACRDELVAAADRARRRGPTLAGGAFDGGSSPYNLPIARTSFVGRDRDVADVKELLERNRLLTLVGPGGIGKTRLAIEVGSELLERYPDGVRFVDLAPIGDPALVVSVVAAALGMSQRRVHRLGAAILPWLQRKRLLLIFDNCEHLVEPASELADAILTAAPDVRILATSRQSLAISGEVTHKIAPLAVPAQTVGLRPDDALGFGAVALFVDRARACDTEFALTDDNAGSVADICRRLDGIALAIELAAARVRMLSIANLARHLHDRFQILSGGNRSAQPRHRTLSALLDWSYDLLPPPERLLFERLGVFVGEFGLDAVMAVCGESLEESDIFELLASLTDKSLIVADTGGQRTRYRLLESTVAYALEKLVASGERERLSRSHAEYFCGLAQTASDRAGTASTIACPPDLEAELSNFRAALEWSLTSGNDVALGGSIAGGLSRLWQNAGLAAEGRYWVELALVRISEIEHPAIAARLQLTLGLFSFGEGKHAAAQRATTLYETHGDVRSASRARRVSAQGLYQMGRLDEAAADLAQALTVFRELGDVGNASYCLNQLAIVEARRNEFRAGRALFAQAIAGLKAIEDDAGTAEALGNLAELEFASGDSARALQLVNEALGCPPLGRTALVDTWHANAAAYRIALGDVDGARDSARKALRFNRQRGPELTPWALQHVALITALDGDTRSAAQLLGYVDARYHELDMEREPTERWSYDRLLALLRESFSNDRIGAWTAQGAGWSKDRAIEEVLDL